MKLLSPSILSADFANLGAEAVAASRAGADYLHIDVMDGHFVPNISYGAAVMRSLDALNTAPYDVHLMIERPDDYLEDFVTSKTEFIVVHQEACRHLHRTIGHIASTGTKAGVAINPGTSITMIEEVLYDVDMVLVMSVNPGFGGQKFIPNALNKVRRLAEMRNQYNLDFLIEIDGGVNCDNISAVVASGVDVVVAGSAVFNKQNSIEESIDKLKRCMK